MLTVSEKDAVLQLLFDCNLRSLPAALPYFSIIEFDLLVDVAEVAEKYSIHTAAALTKMALRARIPDHPMEVLHYAAKFEHKGLMNQAAQDSVLGKTAKEAAAVLPVELFVTWAQYKESWLSILPAANSLFHELEAHEGFSCHFWSTYHRRKTS